MPRSLIRLLAGVFAAVIVLYGAAWMSYIRVQTASTELGFVPSYSEAEHAVVVEVVEEGSPAALAGLRPRDRITVINGRRLGTRDRFTAWDRQRADDQVMLVVTREGREAPVRLVASLLEGVPFSLTGLVETSLLEVLDFYPVIFLGVGLVVLALRPDDPYAWLMAALFASFLVIPQFPRAISGLPPHLATFVRTYRAIALPAIPALFYGFFALFPTRSPLDRKVPWLKWLMVVLWVMFAVPNIRRGAPASPEFLVRWLGRPVADAIRLTYLLGGIPTGILALTWNATSAPTPDARRKARVLFWGTVAGAMPIVVETAAQIFLKWQPPAWVSTGALAMASIFPLSFAYAVVKHRVLDIPVLLQRSARYLLVRRGFEVLLLLIAVSVTAIFTLSLSRLFDVSVNVATAAGVAFGMALSAGAAPLVKRATTRIDRAFFRNAYDATEILEDLADQIRITTSREALGALLQAQITEALHPSAMGVYLEDTDRQLHAFAERWGEPLPVLSASMPFLQELARRGRPWDVSMASKEEPPAFLRESQAECLVPILGKTGRLIGYLLLGPRASEEPYSGHDKRLLASVANHAGVELENISLAEAMAERLDADRAAAREMEIARQVQARLFPQKQPALRTLEYAGGCVQARRVGGDYYDFQDLGPGRLALVVADISGKGIAGALLMANLQANLRSQYAMATDDLPRLLKSVNQLFFENTAENQYATLFIADYSDDTRSLRYANCGHFPPYLLRADGTIEALMPTAMVLGLFEDWHADIRETQLHPDDILVIYTDGIIEATNAVEEEFGTERLLDLARENRALPAPEQVAAIHRAVERFSQGNQSDDLTVVVARVR